MKQKVINLLSQYINELTPQEIDSIIEIPPKSEMGDFAFPCFRLAKTFRKVLLPGAKTFGGRERMHFVCARLLNPNKSYKLGILCETYVGNGLFCLYLLRILT